MLLSVSVPHVLHGLETRIHETRVGRPIVSDHGDEGPLQGAASDGCGRIHLDRRRPTIRVCRVS